MRDPLLGTGTATRGEAGGETASRGLEAERTRLTWPRPFEGSEGIAWLPAFQSISTERLPAAAKPALPKADPSAGGWSGGLL